MNSQLLISRFELVMHCEGISKQTPRRSIFPQYVGIIQVESRCIQTTEEPQVYVQCYSPQLHGFLAPLEFLWTFLLLPVAQNVLVVTDDMTAK